MAEIFRLVLSSIDERFEEKLNQSYILWMNSDREMCEKSVYSDVICRVLNGSQRMKICGSNYMYTELGHADDSVL